MTSPVSILNYIFTPLYLNLDPGIFLISCTSGKHSVYKVFIGIIVYLSCPQSCMELCVLLTTISPGPRIGPCRRELLSMNIRQLFNVRFIKSIFIEILKINCNSCPHPTRNNNNIHILSLFNQLSLHSSIHLTTTY